MAVTPLEMRSSLFAPPPEEVDVDLDEDEDDES